jgi:uncharacterized membrane protein YgdD (TMEM256/DUF423 family)
MSVNLQSARADLKDTLMAIVWARVWIASGALAGLGAVAMAAVAAHALPQRLDPRALHAVESAIQMQGWHALALVLTGLLVTVREGPMLLANLAGGAFLLGLLLFCGAIYAADLAGIHVGPAAPTGGLLFMAGWLLLAASAIVRGRAP